MQITKHQHYVWRFYLKKWIDEKGMIACCRNGNIFRSNLMGIGQEKYFYKLIDLTDKEIWWIKQLCIEDEFPDELKKMDNAWIEAYTLPFKIINDMKKKGIDNKDEFDKIINEGEEKVYSKTEEIGEPYLEMLYKKDTSFYETLKGQSDFNFFIFEQYLRTKKRVEAMKKGSNNELDFSRIWCVVRHILSTNLSFNLIANNLASKKTYLKILNNNTIKNFITGDQPVINKNATNVFQEKKDASFEFYYPLSPKQAILLTETNYSEKELNIQEEIIIKELNDLIFYNSQEQVYGLTENELEQYKVMKRNWR